MIIAGQMLMYQSVGGLATENGWLRVEGGAIVEAAAGPCSHAVDLGGEGYVISPGFIDAHLHLPQFESIGQGDGLPLLEWLEQVIFPAEAKWADASFAGEMGAGAARRLLSHGTTTVAAYGTVHHEGTKAALRALAEAGLRGYVGQVLMDRGAPAELIRPADQLLREAAALRGVGRIEPAVTPRFAVSCTEELLRGAGRLAAQNGQLVQTHLAETEEECALVARLFGGRAYLRVYQDAGLCGGRTVFGHGIWLSAEDRRRLAESGDVIAHCPTANLYLGAGMMNRAAAVRHNMTLALGSDVAGGPDVSMVRVARAMLETAKRVGDGAGIPSAEACWRQITAGNAAALGLKDAGFIGPGAAADLVVFRPDIPGARNEPMHDLSRLLYAWDERWIEAVVVNGRLVKP